MSESQDPLPHLDTFSIAAELGSFTAAGVHLGITQAAVSQRIHVLEKALRVALFDRRGGRVFVTDDGQKLYAYSQKILELHREARHEITGRKTPLTGELLLAASSVPGEYLLPGIVAAFRKQHPAVQVKARQTDSMGALAQVEQGKVHLGLVGRKSESAHLEVEPFAADEMVLVIPPVHRWKRLKQISRKQFSTEPLIIREPDSGSRWCLEQALAQRRTALTNLNIALELGSNEAIKEAVYSGVGVAVISALAVRKELEAGQLYRLKINDLALNRTMFVAWDTRRRRYRPRPASSNAFSSVGQPISKCYRCSARISRLPSPSLF